MKTFINCLLIFIVTMLLMHSIKDLTQELIDRKEIEALAYNIYFEARNSTVEDQIATAVVVLNRGTPSIEVYKKGQFSWTSEYAVPAEGPVLDRCRAIAKIVYHNHKLFRTGDICKHYTTVDAKYNNNHWTKTFKRRKQIGKHYYYCN